jgi:diacylglycerol kinase (ATP)
MLSVKKSLRSFRFAFTGLIDFFRTENNGKIHGIAGLLAMGLGIYLAITPTEWLWISAAIASVLVTEILNTALEHLADAITAEKNEHLRMAKDMAAGAVFVSMLFALVVAAIVFLPKLAGCLS